MIDITELSNLNPHTRGAIQQLLNMAEMATEMDELRAIAKTVFHAAAPSIPQGVLFSEVKDYNRIGNTYEIAESGIHVFRSYLAHQAQRIRRLKHPAVGFAGFEADDLGVAIIDQLFSDRDVEYMQQAVKKYPLATSKDQTVPLWNCESDPLREAVFHRPRLNAGIKDFLFDCLAMDASHEQANTLFKGNTFVQRLHNKAGDGDIQKALHQDTYFPCFKFWYFLDDVTVETGPLEYVIGSHLFTQERAKFIYDQSFVIAANKSTPAVLESVRGPSHAEGSLRALESELADMKLPEPKKITVKANTLVIANVFGFHRRAEVVTEGKRDSIHGSIRVQTPFI